VLFNLTFESARKDASDDVQKQAIQFWDNIACEEEERIATLAEWRDDGADEEEKPEEPAYYVKVMTHYCLK
jgi:hypothetical protein